MFAPGAGLTVIPSNDGKLTKASSPGDLFTTFYDGIGREEPE